MTKTKDHPESPVARCEIKTDSTERAYIIHQGQRYRVKTRMIEVAPRVFRAWHEIKGEGYACEVGDIPELD